MKRRTKHHLLPRSRGGGNEASNIKEVGEAQHRAWHLLFQNMTPYEAIKHILDEWTPDGHLEWEEYRWGELSIRR